MPHDRHNTWRGVSTRLAAYSLAVLTGTHLPALWAEHRGASFLLPWRWLARGPVRRSCSRPVFLPGVERAEPSVVIDGLVNERGVRHLTSVLAGVHAGAVSAPYESTRKGSPPGWLVGLLGNTL
jgi:hypothetical protein